MLAGVQRARAVGAQVLKDTWSRWRVDKGSGDWPGQLAYQLAAVRSTTVLCMRKGDTVLIAADGQVTIGSQIVKPNVRKIRKINDKVLVGYAGATADAFTLFDALEMKIEEYPDQIVRAAVELAKAWRTDKFLRKLEAVLLVADDNHLLEITGVGDVIEPHDGVMAIGSGGPYALAAARALIDIPGMDAKAVAEKAMKIAADICVYSNHNIMYEELTIQQEVSSPASSEALPVPDANPKTAGSGVEESGPTAPVADRDKIQEADDSAKACDGPMVEGADKVTSADGVKGEDAVDGSVSDAGDADGKTAEESKAMDEMQIAGDGKDADGKEGDGKKGDVKVKKEADKRSDGTSKRKK